MDFKLNEEQEAIKKMVSDFTLKEIAPVAAELDEEERFPKDIIEKLDQLGLTNLTVPEEYGGPGIDNLSAAVVAEEMAGGCAGVSAGVTASAIALFPVVSAGSEALKDRYLNEISDHGKLAALALNEPGAGFNVKALTATYRLEGDSYFLNGNKSFIINAPNADYLVVFAGSEKEGADKLSVFLVDAGSDGLSAGKPEAKIGLRAAVTSGISLKDVMVPVENLIGQEGEGHKLAEQTSVLTGVYVGAISTGLARAAMEEAIKFARERVQFGKPIAANQAIQFMLADMAAGIEAARFLVCRAAWMLDQGLSCSSEAAIAKLVSTESAIRIATDAVQILGGYGYTKDYPVEKYMRDAKTLQIYGGIGIIQRSVIAGELLDQAAR